MYQELLKFISNCPKVYDLYYHTVTSDGYKEGEGREVCDKKLSIIRNF